MTFQFSPAETELVARQVATQLPNKAFVKSSSSFYRTYAKRGIDVVLTLITAPVVVPVIMVLALLIMMDGRNPFYTQLRVGRNGKSFRMWKLRTMVHDADARLESYLEANPAARAEWDATQKLKKDPRITWVGSWLRKVSADELPQLFNVFGGSMSLVGPRPMMLQQRKDYTGSAYYDLTPGITGLWQVSDRNECEFVGRVIYDDIYHQTLSLRTDLQVLWKTVSVVLRGTGY